MCVQVANAGDWRMVTEQPPPQVDLGCEVVEGVSGLVPPALSPAASASSPSGKYRLVMQGDGNLVVYVPGNLARWSSRTNAAGSVLKNQQGAMVIVGPNGLPQWSTARAGAGNDLHIQDDGNLVLYASDGRARWDSDGHVDAGVWRLDHPVGFTTLTSRQSVTSANGTYRLVMQTDGNLVEYVVGGGPRWATMTSVAGSRVVVQDDGNMVIYSAAGRPVWWSGSRRQYGVNGTLEDSGRIMVFDYGSGSSWSA